MELKEQVLSTMKAAAKPLRPGEIAELAGIDKKDADKVIKQLKDADLVHSPKRCFYEAR
jgi:DNA-binding MarR family transcriptional regulator